MLSIEQRLRLKQLERDKLAKRARAGDLIAYTKFTYPQYQINWHHLLTGQYLNRFLKHEIRRLMIFEPPRYGKTELTSRRLPALIHGLYPNDEILAASYNGDLASDNTIDVQRIMDTPPHKLLFPNSQITPEGTISKYARNSSEHELIPYKDPKGELVRPTGSYRSAGVGGSFTGRGGKWVLIDDPVKNRQDADSKQFRDMMWDFYTSTIRTRLEGEAGICITMTRWHNDDLAGRLIKLAKSDPNADQWKVLILPAIKEDDDNPEDPREIGEPLWADKFPLQSLIATKASIGSRDWASLYRQTPNVEGGNIIRSEWIKYYGGRNQPPLPRKFDQLIQSWDFATKDKQKSDFNVGQIWGRLAANYYLIHQVRGRWAFPIACKELLSLCRMYPSVGKKLVEAKANGPAVVQTLRSLVPGLVEVEPNGDKVARLNAVAPFYESGNVWYPDPEIAPWIGDHVSELCDFPRIVNDDQVDTASQALHFLRSATPIGLPIAGHGSGVIF